VTPIAASARPSWTELIASHISALITSRTARAPSRARWRLATTEFAFAGSVLSSATVSARDGRPDSDVAVEPMIAAPRPRTTSRRRVVGARLEVGLEDAVDHARGQFGARDVRPSQKSSVSDPGEHQATAGSLRAESAGIS